MKLLLQSWCLLISSILSVSSSSQAPSWSSLPSAPATIFLDFDGHTVEGSSWNWSVSSIVCAPSGLADATKLEIFNRVAEDFRPFNLNITTDSTRFLAAPLNQRMRVIITPSSGWYGSSAGGVAFINSFTWGDDHPCFVFSVLLNNNAKKIAEAVSHEAGHTLGLYHQSQYDSYCNKLTDYYGGQGTGEIGWAPIMGIGYSRNFTLWSNGPNSLGCDNYQSDLDIITSEVNGFGYRDDDHGNDFSGSTQLLFANQQFEMNGVITRNSDEDMFHFIMPDRAVFKLNATPYNVGAGNAGSDLDLQISLYDEAGNLVNVYNPGNLLNSVADTTLNPGRYFLKVEGRGNIYAPSYASLGSYSLHGAIEGGTPLPVINVLLDGTLTNDYYRFHWNIEADEPVIQQTLEIAGSNGSFGKLEDIAINSQDFSYAAPAMTSDNQYRLKIVFAGGKIFYSNVIMLSNNEFIPKPKITGNPFKSGIVFVKSGGNYRYAIFDISGKRLQEGKIIAGMNNIDMRVTVPGIYFIRFNDATHQWTDKILRQ
jgi:hypothetical protein